MDKNKVIFIIAHKYIRGYESYLKHYINNILLFYENSLIIIVDNNSIHKEDIFDTIEVNKKIIILDNNIECKFELGAYQVGLKYIIDNNLTDKYNYVVMTQDNFIIKNKLDFNILHNKNVTACPINGCTQDRNSNEFIGVHNDFLDTSIEILNKLGLNDNLDKISFCWCVSFIISSNKIQQLYSYLKNIIITIRWQCCASERYMARILWELNNKENYDIDGDIRDLKHKYDCHSVNLLDDVPTFFAKRVQGKN